MAQLLSPSRRRRRGRGEDGVGMAMTMVVVTVVFSLGAVWLTFANHSTGAAGYERRRQQAIDAANAGLVVAAAALGRTSAYAGTPVRASTGGSAEYEVTVLCSPSLTPPPCPSATLGRRIEATGYAPAKTAGGRVARRLRQTVQLVPQLGGAGFPYAIMSAQGIKTGSNASIVGDIYANEPITLGNSHSMVGNVYAQSTVTTGSNFTLTGDIWAKGDVDVVQASEVKGSVTTQGSLTVRGTIENSAVASGAITDYPAACSRTGAARNPPTGTCAQYAQVESPPQQQFPTFQYDPAQHPGVVTYTSGPDMVTALANATFSGTHYVNGSPTFTKNQTWYLSGDTTILVNGSITLPGRIVNARPGGQELQLSVISTSTPLGGITPPNNLTIPATVRTLLYGGSVGSSSPSNSIALSGSVYARDLSLGANLQITYEEVTAPPGFTFTGGGVVTSYNIRNVSTQEVAVT